MQQPSGAPTPTPASAQRLIWPEDVVTLTSDTSKVGLVQRTAWDDDNQQDGDEDEEDLPLPEGQAMVMWFENNEAPVVSADLLTILDRAMFPGDIVARVTDRQGQMGTILSVQITLDLKLLRIGHVPQQHEEEQRRNGVKAEDCSAVHPYRDGTCVVSAEWIGAVEEVEEDVYVQFPNGALGVVHKCNEEYLSHAEDATNADYTLCERVYLTPAGMKQITWLSKATVGTGNKRNRWGRVMDIKATAVHVAWLYTSGCSAQPESPITVESVRVVEAFPHTFFTLGDVVRVAGTDETTAAQIRSVRTLTDVQWQDGTITHDLHSAELVPVEATLGEQDFWPDDFVIAACNAASPPVTALVKRVSVADRTLVVQSLRELEANTTQEVKEEEFAVYDVREHKEFQFRIGSYVARVVDLVANETDEEEVVRTDRHYAGAWAGAVVAMSKGRLEVAWCDGSRSSVQPSDVLLVELEDLLDARADEQDQEDEEFDDGDEGEEEEEEEGEEDEGVEHGRDDGDDGSDDGEYSEEEEKEVAAAKDKKKPAKKDSKNKAIAMPSEEATTSLAPSPLPALPQSPASESALPVPVRPDLFQLCDVPPPVHHYLPTAAPTAPERGWTARVTREWTALRGGLPGGIVVRAFDSRMDLLSVLITGPRATPYYDCVFLFDILLPPTYPNVPPQVYYRSAIATKFHPNLHADGHVCLSLLGTWAGKHASENWSAASTLLQLVVSIQGLLLVPEPYYLEAGYEAQRGTEAGVRSSRLYNELAVLKSVESCVTVARRAPAPFEASIRLHLADRGAAILARCVDLLAKEAKNEALEASALTAPLSLGFIKALTSLTPQLEAALAALKP